MITLLSSKLSVRILLGLFCLVLSAQCCPTDQLGKKRIYLNNLKVFSKSFLWKAKNKVEQEVCNYYYYNYSPVRFVIL